MNIIFGKEHVSYSKHLETRSLGMSMETLKPLLFSPRNCIEKGFSLFKLYMGVAMYFSSYRSNENECLKDYGQSFKDLIIHEAMRIGRSIFENHHCLYYLKRNHGYYIQYWNKETSIEVKLVQGSPPNHRFEHGLKERLSTNDSKGLFGFEDFALSLFCLYRELRE